jgi:hypothetical protein
MDFTQLLDLLKAGGWQAGAVAAAAALFLVLSATGTIPKPDAWMLILAWALLLLGAALAIASLGEPVTKLGRSWILRRQKAKALASAKEAFRREVPYLTSEERNVLGYLLAHKQKTFVGAIDGGHASTLLGRGYVGILARPGQHVATEDVPFAVADYVWEVMESDPTSFQYKPEYRGSGRNQVEVHPWRVAMW